jgi:hypothetical protein
MPLTNPYCTLEAVQRETGNSDSEQEAWFENCINGASRWIDDHCNRDFLLHDHAATAYTVKHGEVVGDLICLSWPILTLTEVKTGALVIPAQNYYFDAGSRTIRTRDGSLWGARKGSLPFAPSSSSGMYSISVTAPREPITIKGTFGYATPPTAVSMACAKIASAWSHEKRRERSAMDGSRVSILDERIPDDALALLKRYRRLIH